MLLLGYALLEAPSASYVLTRDNLYTKKRNATSILKISMEIHTLLFDLFASIALISAAMVIVSRNPIHSVIFLILVFCNAAGLLLLLKIEFIAMMFLIIYVGAIAVLFLFVVMMLNIKINELSDS